MDDMERIKEIRRLQRDGYTKERKQSLVVNNFYAIITIGVVCIAMIFYTNYIVPAQEAKQQRELQIKKKEEYFEQRAKQIALSKKLNQQQEEERNVSK